MVHISISREFCWKTKAVPYVSNSYSELAGTNTARLLEQFRGKSVV